MSMKKFNAEKMFLANLHHSELSQCSTNAHIE